MTFTEEQIRDMEKAAKLRAEAKANDERAAAAGPPEPIMSKAPPPAPASPNMTPAAFGPRDLPDAPLDPVSIDSLPNAPAPPPVGAQPNQRGNPSAPPFSGTGPMEPRPPPAPAPPPPGPKPVDSGPMYNYSGESPVPPPGAPTPPVPADDANMGGPSAGGGGTPYSPGGMRPYSEERDIHFAKGLAPGSKEAVLASGMLQQSAATTERDANREFFDQQKHFATLKLQANQSAMLQQQRLAEDREREVGKRMAQIEDLNTQARGKPEDVWGDGVIFARLMGTLLMGLGAAATVGNKGRNASAGMGLMISGGFVNGLINQDIEDKLRERKGAGEQAKAQTDLLHLHEQNLGDRGKAIEATKLAYYDSVLQQMEIVNAEHQGEINEVKYKRLQAQIIDEKNKTFQDLHDKETNDEHAKQVNKMTAPSGGPGAAAPLKDIPNTITLSDGTAWELGDSAGADKARERIVAMQKLKDINARIVKLRQKAYVLDPLGDAKEYSRIYAQLEDLGEQKAPMMSMALDGSSIRKDERAAIEAKSIHSTEGLGYPGVPFSNAIPKYSAAKQAASDSVIDQQSGMWEKAQQTEASAIGAREVVRGSTTNSRGGKDPVAVYTGRIHTPESSVAPKGFEPDDASRPVEKQGPTLAERSRQGRDFGRQDLPAPSATRVRKKK